MTPTTYPTSNLGTMCTMATATAMMMNLFSCPNQDKKKNPPIPKNNERQMRAGRREESETAN